MHVISWTESNGMIGEEDQTIQYSQEKTFRKRRSESLYLGGAPNNLRVTGLTGGLYSNALKGCISHLEIRKRTPKSFGGVIDLKTNANNKNVLDWSETFCVETCNA